MTKIDLLEQIDMCELIVTALKPAPLYLRTPSQKKGHGYKLQLYEGILESLNELKVLKEQANEKI